MFGVRYLDTDVVVTSDLAELASFNLHGFAAGAAEDCSQRMGNWADGWRPSHGLRPFWMHVYSYSKYSRLSTGNPRGLEDAF